MSKIGASLTPMKQIYRKPDYCVGDIRRIDGVILIWAFVWNCGNQSLDDKEETQMAETMRVRVPMQDTGADQPVVVRIAGNADGAKRLD